MTEKKSQQTPSRRAWGVAKPVAVLCAILAVVVLSVNEHSVGGIIMGALIDGAVCGMVTWVVMGIAFWVTAQAKAK